MIGLLLCLFLASTLSSLVSNDTLMLLFENVRTVFQKEDAKNVLLEFGCIHLATKNGGRSKKRAFQFFKGKFCH